MPTKARHHGTLRLIQRDNQEIRSSTKTRTVIETSNMMLGQSGILTYSIVARARFSLAGMNGLIGRDNDLSEVLSMTDSNDC